MCRGGGGGPVSWHQDGTMRNKINSIYDFVACGNYLVSEGYVGREMLCAIGYSAGGLLVGASINMNPNLFCAAILKVSRVLTNIGLLVLFSLIFQCNHLKEK